MVLFESTTVLCESTSLLHESTTVLHESTTVLCESTSLLHGSTLCRRGRGLGIDFFHCMSCNACMSLSLFKSHRCREKAMESNCPVCSEFLFDSADSIKVRKAFAAGWPTMGETSSAQTPMDVQVYTYINGRASVHI
jgi:hypothetical protein